MVGFESRLKTIKSSLKGAGKGGGVLIVDLDKL